MQHEPKIPTSFLLLPLLPSSPCSPALPIPSLPVPSSSSPVFFTPFCYKTHRRSERASERPTDGAHRGFLHSPLSRASERASRRLTRRLLPSLSLVSAPLFLLCTLQFRAFWLTSKLVHFEIFKILFHNTKAPVLRGSIWSQDSRDLSHIFGSTLR